mgnify:CR=1 FL=1
MKDLEKKWDLLIRQLEKQFEYDITLKGVLYLIGLQELNMPEKNYSKEEKMDVLHIATCKILSQYGYYKLTEIDKDGWPHYKEIKALKNLSEQKQERLIKEAIIKYINKL